jgi:Uma2 family endonuclease
VDRQGWKIQARVARRVLASGPRRQGDESFYLTNEPAVREREEIDLDPPPDLMLEVDITRSSRARMGVYAAMRVPEVWRFDGEAVSVCGDAVL